jgi:hypothetical protein
MGTRHFYCILTSPSFAVHTPSQKNYRKKYKQRSSNYKLKHFSVGKSLFYSTYLYTPLERPENVQRNQNITLNSLVILFPILILYKPYAYTYTEQIYIKTLILCLAHQENILYS